MTVWPSVEKVMKDIRRLGLGRKHVLMRSSTWPRLKMKPVCSQEEGTCQFFFSPHQRFCFWVHFPNLEVSLTLMKDCRYPSEGSLWRHAAFLEECTRMASWSNLIPLTPSRGPPNWFLFFYKILCTFTPLFPLLHPSLLYSHSSQRTHSPFWQLFIYIPPFSFPGLCLLVHWHLASFR